MKTAIYIRISKEDTRRGKSMSPEMQIEKCLQYCGFRDLTNHEIYQDLDISGRVDSRPEFTRLLQDVADRKIDNVVCYSMSRLSRSLKTFLHTVELFKKKKVTFHSVKEMIDLSSSTGRLLANVFGALNEFEVEQTSERTSDNLQLRKSQLKVYGKNAPYGFEKKDGNLVVDLYEAKIIQEVFKLAEQGKGAVAIQNRLNKDFKPRLGKAFWLKSVQNILANKEFYSKHFTL